MKLAIIIIVGIALFVGIVALAVTFLIGLTEAADPEQAAAEDLTELERSLVDRDEDSEEGSRS